MTITLDNDPTSSTMIVTMSDDGCTQSYTYGDSFVGDNGFDVYLSMDSPYDSPVIIESVKFEYNSTNYTSYPTAIPTTAPTELEMFLGPHTMNWDDANSHCEDEGGYLLSIHSVCDWT